ncbi:MAG: GNAT family N-acetyltransferase [Lachnospiraceae bacterium]|nr:GNAT family N-acetyltransferase [Lachnospiraceae bacterium]
METGWIGQDNLASFRSLLLPEAAEALEKGEPLGALGLTEEGVACGAAAAWLSGETLEIRSFYVAPEYRRLGGGRLLMETFLRFAARHGAALEFSYTGTRPEHDTIPPFLGALGFVRIDTEETIYSLSVRELAESPFFKGAAPDTSAVLSFEQLPARALEVACKKEAAVGEDYLEGGLTGPDVDVQTSVVVMSGREIRSFMAFTASDPDSLSLAWVKGGEAEDLPLLFRAAFARICEKYSPETRFIVQAVNPSAVALIRGVIPAAVPVSHTWVKESVSARAQKEE